VPAYNFEVENVVKFERFRSTRARKLTDPDTVWHVIVDHAIQLRPDLQMMVGTGAPKIQKSVKFARLYRVTCIIVNDFESNNLYVVNFINRQTLYHSIGMINKII